MTLGQREWDVCWVVVGFSNSIRWAFRCRCRCLVLFSCLAFAWRSTIHLKECGHRRRRGDDCFFVLLATTITFLLAFSAAFKSASESATNWRTLALLAHMARFSGLRSVWMMWHVRWRWSRPWRSCLTMSLRSVNGRPRVLSRRIRSCRFRPSSSKTMHTCSPFGLMSVKLSSSCTILVRPSIVPFVDGDEGTILLPSLASCMRQPSLAQPSSWISSLAISAWLKPALEILRATNFGGRRLQSNASSLSSWCNISIHSHTVEKKPEPSLRNTQYRRLNRSPMFVG